MDSPLEGTGFELLVPRREARDFRSIPEQLRADDLNRSRRLDQRKQAESGRYEGENGLLSGPRQARANCLGARPML